LATIPSNPCVLTACTRSGRLPQDLPAKDVAALRERLLHHVLPGQDQHVEDVVHDGQLRRASVLEQVEGGTAGCVQGDNFAVDHGLVGQRCERLDDARVCGVEILVVAGTEEHLAVGFDGQGPVPIELDLVRPLRALGQR
jgi:hypothetical protein